MEFAVAVRVVASYVRDVTFDSGERRRVDMEPLLAEGVFVPLQDPHFFARVVIDPVLGTVVWPNGADVSPEFLYWGTDGPPPGYDDLQEEPENKPKAAVSVATDFS